MTPTDHVRRMFATFDAKDVSALAAFMTDDVRLRLGNTEPMEPSATGAPVALTGRMLTVDGGLVLR
jgi:ketosteroid isomerase-like protein